MVCWSHVNKEQRGTALGGKSYEERLRAYDKRIQQFQARKDQLEAKLKEQDRKQRTRRLIQVGAIMAHVGIETVEQAETLRRIIQGNSRLADALRLAITVATDNGPMWGGVNEAQSEGPALPNG